MIQLLQTFPLQQIMWLSLLHVLHVFVCMDPTSGSHPLPWHRSSLRLSVRVPLLEVFAPSNEMPPRTISAPLPSPSCCRRFPRLAPSTQHLQTLSQERIGQWWVFCITVAANTAGSSRFQMWGWLKAACSHLSWCKGPYPGTSMPLKLLPGVTANHHLKELDYLITSGDFCLMLP